MSWLKISDDLPMHPKVLALQRRGQLAALSPWTLALARAGQQGTDGVVDRDYLQLMFGDLSEHAAALVDVGLWDTAEDGWRIHDFADYNPTSQAQAEVSAKRREAGKKGAAVRWGKQPDSTLPSGSHSDRIDSASAPHDAANGPVPVPVPNPEQSRRAQARPHQAEAVEAILQPIAARLGIAAPSADTLDELLTQHIDRDAVAAAREVRAWSQRENLRNLLGALKRALTDAHPPKTAPASGEACPNGTTDPAAIAAWAAVLPKLSERLSESDFGIWIEPMHAHRVEGDTLVIAAPDEIRKWLDDRFAGVLTAAIDGPYRLVTCNGEGHR